MLEPVLVEQPVGLQACTCGSQKAPLLRTFREIGGVEEYVCQACAKSYARLFGFAKGERLDELSEAASTVAAKDREITSLTEQLGESTMQVESRDKHILALDGEIEILEARVQSFERAAREQQEVAARAAALVGDAA